MALIYKINRLRNLLNRQLESKEIDWGQVEKISKELDLLIIEYYKDKEQTEEDGFIK
jgi:hypothetical protein